MTTDIYARAVPKTIRLTETYSYEQVISRNPSFKQKKDPSGKIEIAVPYDGHDYFKREAYQDVIQQINNDSPNQPVNAIIGYLVMNGYDRTDLDNLLLQAQPYGSIPLKIPVINEQIQHEQLCQERHLCILDHSYQPGNPELQPIKIHINVLDDDIFLIDLPAPIVLNNLDDTEAENLGKRIDRHLYNRTDHPLNGNLILDITVRVVLPRNLHHNLSPKVKRLSLEWPTITSIESLSFSIGKDYKHENIRYNPINNSLEWTADAQNNDALMRKEKSTNSDAEWQTYTQNMLVWIRQPGELYEQPSLKGEVEVEIAEQLLSGLQIRFYGFYNAQVGKYNPNLPQLSTRLNTSFELFLDEAFKKRNCSILQKLQFGNIIPNEDSIIIIGNELNYQGFYLQERPLNLTSTDDGKEWRWLISAWRSEGVDTMVLWILIRGTEYSIEKEADRRTVKYDVKDQSGNLIMYLLGQFPRSSHKLIQKINVLQKGLREKFERLQLEK